MAFSVGDSVVNVGRGSWAFGVIVGIVPSGESGFRVAVRIGCAVSDIREGSSRVGEAYLVETVDSDGRIRVRFPLVTGLRGCKNGS